MTATSTIEPGFGNAWSSIGAIVFVSVLGPALILLFTMAPIFLVELRSVFLDFRICRYVGSCAPSGDGSWSSSLLGQNQLLFALWVTVGTGFACIATLESAFYVFRRAAPITVLCWYALLIFILSLFFPIESVRSLFALGWGGSALVSMHYYCSYKALTIYQPPKPAAERTQDASLESRKPAEPTGFPSGLNPRQQLELGFSVLHTTAIFGLALYAFAEDKATMFVISLGLALYLGLHLLYRIVSCSGPRALTTGSDGLTFHGQCLSWGEIGRVWRGPDGHGHVVMIETPAVTAKRMLRANNWVYRLFELCEVARKNDEMVAHSVLIDTRFYLGGAAELVQLIEASRPPGSRWMPAAEAT